MYHSWQIYYILDRACGSECVFGWALAQPVGSGAGCRGRAAPRQSPRQQTTFLEQSVQRLWVLVFALR
eukprot:3312142-Rhodomonas_salina.1